MQRAPLRRLDSSPPPTCEAPLPTHGHNRLGRLEMPANHPTRQFAPATLNAEFAPDCSRPRGSEGATGFEPFPLVRRRSRSPTLQGLREPEPPLKRRQGFGGIFERRRVNSQKSMSHPRISRGVAAADSTRTKSVPGGLFATAPAACRATASLARRRARGAAPSRRRSACRRSGTKAAGRHRYSRSRQTSRGCRSR